MLSSGWQTALTSPGKSQGEFPGGFIDRREMKKKDAELRQELNSSKGKDKIPSPGLEGAEEPMESTLNKDSGGQVRELQHGLSNISVYTNIKEGNK